MTVQYESTTIENTRQKADVSVVKKDSDTENPLDGGKYTLYAGNDIKNYAGPVIIRYMLDEEAMENTLATPNLSQAIRIKKMQEEENISVDSVEAIITEVKQKEITRVVFKNEQLYRYFPSYYTAEQMRREILTLLKINMESY